MIICSCNVITDRAIRDIVATTDVELGSAAQVYDCLGCAVRCGLCSRSVRSILEERPAGRPQNWPIDSELIAPCAQLTI
jgi:bacterioferritin-associated ferredoxin